MKIISINKELTVSENEIVFNLDEDITFDISSIEYGTLTISGSGRIIKIKKDYDVPGFTSENVKTLNAKLEQAKKAIEAAASEASRNHQDMLAGVSKMTGLDVD